MADSVPSAEVYREYATHLVMGDSWFYDELVEFGMDTWRATVDRVALALVDERRAGLLAPASPVADEEERGADDDQGHRAVR